MQPLDAAGRTYDVERRAYHATRPGFRITQIEISPAQVVPWHCHTSTQDTFYVISGTIRISTREPDAEVCLTIGESCSVRPGRPHRVANAGETSAVFLILQGMGEHDFVALA